MATDFLADLEWRGLLHQVTDREAANRAFAAGGCVGYIGFDPTADSLHVGSLLQITLLARLALAGHAPIALVGGGTGMIGDPSGKSAERKLQTDDDVRANAAAIRAQIARVADHIGEVVGQALHLQFEDNASWLNSLGMIPFLRDVGKHFSVNAMVQRDSVKTRLEAREQGISYTEFSYMLLQAYDFLELYRRHGCQLQLGGSDQWGNIVSGSDLIGRMTDSAKDKPAFGVTVPLITQKNGQKFGKTESGTVWLDPARTSPYQFYQFWMNVEDAEVGPYLRYFTFLPPAEVTAMLAAHDAAPHLRGAQATLAYQLTALVHGQENADGAKGASAVLFGGHDPADASQFVFERYVRHEVPTHTPAPDATTLALLVGEHRPFPSNGEAKRAVQANAVSLNGKKITLDDLAKVPSRLHDRYVLIRHGKKSYFLADFGG